MASKPTKEYVAGLLTKYVNAHKAGESDTLKKIREEVQTLAGATDPKKEKK